MKFLYWNLKSNSNLEKIISDCICENTVDIAVFSEYENINFELLKQTLNNNFKLLESFGGCENIKILFKNNLHIQLIQEQHRYLLAKLHYKNRQYLLIGVHLQSNVHSNSDDRKNEIRKIINDITSFETFEIYSSIVIGDMNASPFDTEMIGKDAFNAVLFKKIIKQSDIVTYQNEDYKRFYNPIIEYVNETNEIYGSFYYSSGNSCLYWYCYDQILVRKELIDNIVDLTYLKQIKKNSLLKDIKPNPEISDHLPLVVNIKI